MIRKICFNIFLIITFLCLLLSQPIILTAQESKESSDNSNIESLGTLCSSNLYLSFLSITLIKESIVKNRDINTYNDIIGSVETTLNNTKDILKQMKADYAGVENDKQWPDNILEIYKHLSQDCSLLKIYLKSGKAVDFNNFLAKHEIVFSKINEIFGESKADTLQKETIPRRRFRRR